MVVPKSEEENKEVLKRLAKHEIPCLVQESCKESKTNNWDCYIDEPVTWIGLKQNGKIWFEIDKPSVNDEYAEELNYTNWDPSGTASGWGDAECAYMKGNGDWRYGTVQKCNSVVLKLCPICYVYGTPVFTFKGFDRTEIFTTIINNSQFNNSCCTVKRKHCSTHHQQLIISNW